MKERKKHIQIKHHFPRCFTRSGIWRKFLSYSYLKFLAVQQLSQEKFSSGTECTKAIDNGTATWTYLRSNTTCRTKDSKPSDRQLLLLKTGACRFQHEGHRSKYMPNQMAADSAADHCHCSLSKTPSTFPGGQESTHPEARGRNLIIYFVLKSSSRMFAG